MGKKNKFNVSHADFEINPGHTSDNVDTLIWFSGEKSGLPICMCVSSAYKWSLKPWGRYTHSRSVSSGRKWERVLREKPALK